MASAGSKTKDLVIIFGDNTGRPLVCRSVGTIKSDASEAAVKMRVVFAMAEARDDSYFGEIRSVSACIREKWEGTARRGDLFSEEVTPQKFDFDIDELSKILDQIYPQA